MPPDPMGRKTDGPAGSCLRESEGNTDDQPKGGYGDDTAWTNIFGPSPASFVRVAWRCSC